MNFSRDPTSRGDEIAELMRDYYEAHREFWWDRIWQHWKYTSDDLMLGLLGVALGANAAAEKQDREDTAT